MGTLVKNSATLKLYIPADGSTLMESCTPQITNAEHTYIKKVIGAQVYNDLVEGVANDDLTDDETALLDVVLQALVPISYYLGSAIGSVRFGDTGMHTAQTQDKERLPKWMFDYFRNQCCFDGFNAIDRLFIYLEQQDQADWYEHWIDSDAYTTHSELLVNKAVVFNRHVEINGSRWFFEKLLPMVRNTELLFAQSALGKEVYDDLLEAYIAEAGSGSGEALSADEAHILELIQKSISLMTYSKAMRDLKMITEMIITTASRADDVKIDSINLADYSGLSRDYESMAQGVMQQVIAYLNEKASETVFAIWFASDKYVNPATVNDTLHTDKRTLNSTSKGSFFMPR